MPIETPRISAALARVHKRVAEMQSAFLTNARERASGRTEFIYDAVQWLYFCTCDVETGDNEVFTACFGLVDPVDRSLPELTLQIDFHFDGTPEQKREAQERWMELTAQPSLPPPESTEEANYRANGEIRIPKSVVVKVTGDAMSISLLKDRGWHPPRGGSVYPPNKLH